MRKDRLGVPVLALLMSVASVFAAEKIEISPADRVITIDGEASD